MIFTIISFIALLLLMLVTGIFWGPWFALHRSLHTFDSKTFIRIVKTIARNLALPMRLLMPACLLSMLLSLVCFPHKGSLLFYSSMAAFGLSVLALVITLMVEVPIVGRVLGWTEDTIPGNWETLRNRWVKFHVLRTFLSLAAFALFSASLLGLQLSGLDGTWKRGEKIQDSRHKMKSGEGPNAGLSVIASPQLQIRHAARSASI